jgi:hypothetical protein
MDPSQSRTSGHSDDTTRHCRHIVDNGYTNICPTCCKPTHPHALMIGKARELTANRCAGCKTRSQPPIGDDRKNCYERERTLPKRKKDPYNFQKP